MTNNIATQSWQDREPLKKNPHQLSSRNPSPIH